MTSLVTQPLKITFIVINQPSWWRHQMETFSALMALCAGNSSVTSEFPPQRPVMRVMFSLIFAWINVWVNNREAGDLGRHCAHYDVIVMITRLFWPGGLIKHSCTPLIASSVCIINVQGTRQGNGDSEYNRYRHHIGTPFTLVAICAGTPLVSAATYCEIT